VTSPLITFHIVAAALFALFEQFQMHALLMHPEASNPESDVATTLYHKIFTAVLCWTFALAPLALFARYVESSQASN